MFLAFPFGQVQQILFVAQSVLSRGLSSLANLCGRSCNAPSSINPDHPSGGFGKARAGLRCGDRQRVMESVTQFIGQKLKLKVNETKSAVADRQERKFLGFSFTDGSEVKRVIAPKALERFKKRIREITCRAKSVSLEATMAELVPYLRGWRGYFGFCETPEVLIGLIRWVRLRLRAALWRQWKTPRRRRAALWN